MSQMGMNLPGARRRQPTMDMYTGLLFVAVVCLAAACVVVWMNGSIIGKGSALGLQDPPDASGTSRLELK